MDWADPSFRPSVRPSVRYHWFLRNAATDNIHTLYTHDSEYYLMYVRVWFRYLQYKLVFQQFKVISQSPMENLSNGSKYARAPSMLIFWTRHVLHRTHWASSSRTLWVGFQFLDALGFQFQRVVCSGHFESILSHLQVLQSKNCLFFILIIVPLVLMNAIYCVSLCNVYKCMDVNANCV